MTRARGRAPTAMLGVLAIGAALWLFGARPAAGGPQEDDGVPSGTVAFFAGGACPNGWAVAANMQGRLVVGAVDAAGVGVQVGAPLGDEEDRFHKHPYAGMVNLPYKSISAGDGSTNGAAAGSYPVAGTSVGQTSGLPFAQVQACAKQ